MRTIPRLGDLKSMVGEELAVSNWFVVDQGRINQFADATGDHQWIHVDPDRAASGPFGATIAHGFLTLSMLPRTQWQSLMHLDTIKVRGGGLRTGGGGLSHARNFFQRPGPSMCSQK